MRIILYNIKLCLTLRKLLIVGKLCICDEAIPFVDNFFSNSVQGYLNCGQIPASFNKSINILTAILDTHRLIFIQILCFLSDDSNSV